VVGPARVPRQGRAPAVPRRPVVATDGSGAAQADPHEPLPPGLAPDVVLTLRALRMPALWVDRSGTVLWAHPATDALRLTRRRLIRVPTISALVLRAQQGGQTVQDDLSVRRPGRRQPDVRLRVRVAPMRDGACLVLVEDVSEAERLDHARRDFVANVSHELKTPVGALSLLAEAVVQGRDDPDAVEHFAGRMVEETRRLTTLINDLMDLSRLEGIDRLHPVEPVDLDAVVAQACDDTRQLAASKEIRFLRGGTPGLHVEGVPDQLATAVRNLLVNAISYSSESTKVAVTTGQSDGWVTIAVTDQGIGIPTAELDRIFERFYRVDPARSRDTGGTGLGLAIVKHVCANHGGAVDVWSRVGAGSTFTIRLPELAPAPRADHGRLGPAKEDT